MKLSTLLVETGLPQRLVVIVLQRMLLEVAETQGPRTTALGLQPNDDSGGIRELTRSSLF